MTKERGNKLLDEYSQVTAVSGQFGGIAKIFLTIKDATDSQLSYILSKFPDVELDEQSRIIVEIEPNRTEESLDKLKADWRAKVSVALIEAPIPNLPEWSGPRVAMPPVKPPRPEVTYHLNDQPEPVEPPVGKPDGENPSLQPEPTVKQQALVFEVFNLSDLDMAIFKVAFPDAVITSPTTFHFLTPNLEGEELKQWGINVGQAVQGWMNNPASVPRPLFVYPPEHLVFKDVPEKPETIAEMAMKPIKLKNMIVYPQKTDQGYKILMDRPHDLGDIEVKTVHTVFPELVYVGGNIFYLPVPIKFPSVLEEGHWLSSTMRTIDDWLGSVPGVQPSSPWPRDGQQVNEPETIRRFLTEERYGQAPPRPGSKENDRQVAIRKALDEHRYGDIEGVTQLLKEQVETLTFDHPEDAFHDTAIASLAALQRVQEENRKRKNRRIVFRLLAILFLIAVSYGGYQWATINAVPGSYTVVTECSVPYGTDRITGQRHRTYAYQSLFGYRAGKDQETVTERTEIKLPGDNITILGFNPDKAKWWRQSYGKGDTGTITLKPTDKYWFVGDKMKTSLVTYEDFCK